jgi:gentisate 1,2-dioxygenase
MQVWVEKVSLEKGDLIINPRNEWHDHGHEGTIPALWLDVLDVPLVDVVDAQFREWSDQAKQKVNFADGHSNLLLSNGLRVTTTESFNGKRSYKSDYIRKYTYINSRRSLNELMVSQKLDPYKGAELVYVDPLGRSVLPTIDAFLQGIPSKFSTLSYQSTETKILVVTEGELKIDLDNKSYVLKENDIFLIPSWRKYSMTGITDCVIFSASNKPLLVSADLWYELKE